MWKELVTFFVTLETVFGATLVQCQEGLNCQPLGDHLEETSFDFLNKFTQKQYRSVVSLSMPNASVNKVDPKLKYLKNLQYLDLSHNSVQISSIPSLVNLKTLRLNGNNLKYINLTALPQNIETLDLSHNLLAQIPKDWRSLRALKTLHLYKNPIDCDCNNVLNFDRLIKSGVIVPESVTCHSPKKYAGKEITAVNCSLDDIMLYDEPEMGSGGTYEEANEENIPFVHEKEDDDAPEINTIIYDKLTDEELLEVHSTENPLGVVYEEGSGDEGSGFGGIDDTGVLGCFENCSTPGPIGEKDEAYASPLPSVIDQAKTFLEDINPFKEDESTTTTTTTTTATTTTTVAVPVVEPEIIKIKKTSANEAHNKNNDVEVIGNGTNTGELERASVVPKNSNAVYAIIGVGLFLAVVFTICFIKKRNAKKSNAKRHELPNSLGEELKPLNKSSVKPVNEKPLKNASNIPEHIPLINGQNGKTKDDPASLNTFIPLAHPESDEKDEVEDESDRPNIQDDNPDDVEVRQKSNPELLTPQRERVTIKETEIPDSIPRTPLLVHRQRNSDGDIVTTVVP